MMSGIRKFVRTSPMSTSVEASRGKPFTRTPTSEVVPPMSTTTASLAPERNARAAHAVRRPGREREDRVLLRELGAHQRSVVLADVEVGADAEVVERRAEGRDDRPRELAEARVQDRGVLALEQADAPDVAGERHVEVRDLFQQDLGRALLHLGGHRREDRRQCGRANPLPPDVRGNARESPPRRAARSTRPLNSFPPWTR